MYARPCRVVPHTVEEELLKQAEPAILAIVNRVFKSYRFHDGFALGKDDMLQEARIEVWKAAKRFDPSKGVKFTTFVERRIHGAIVDYLRRADCLSRSHRAEVIASGDPEYGQSLSINAHDDLNQSLIDVIPDTHTDALTNLINEDEANMLIKQLDDRRMHVVKMYFLDESSQRQIAQSMGVHESYISQLVRDSIKRIRHSNRVVVQESKSRPPAIRFKWGDFIKENVGKQVDIPAVWSGRQAEFRMRLKRALRLQKTTRDFKWRLDTKNGVCKITRVN